MEKRTDAATTISKLFKVTPAYVRMVINDRRKKKYNSIKANGIRSAYKNYLAGKKVLIRTIKQVA